MLPATLPSDYYLSHFLAVLDDVRHRYAALLSPAETAFHADFLALPADAQKLWVRLLTRRGDTFLLRDLHYAEIADPIAAAQALCTQEFASLTALETPAWLRLLTIPRLRDLAQSLCIKLPTSLRKEDCVQFLSTEADTAMLDLLRAQYPLLQTRRHEAFETFRLCFFGNRYQNLSEFVLDAMGTTRYEPYPLRANARLFDNRQALDTLHHYFHVAELIDTELGELSAGQILQFAEKLPDPGAPPLLRRRRDRLLNTFARQLERLQDVESALHLYSVSTQPPARERRLRILSRAGCDQEAKTLHDAILRDPWSEQEYQFALQFHQGRQRHRKAQDWPEEHWLLPDTTEPVEQQVASQLSATQGGWVVHAENLIFNAVFGLYCWDVIFADVADAFHQPFQRGPADLFDSGFRSRRAEWWPPLLENLRREGAWRETVLQRFDEKSGVANWLVNWRALPREWLERALPRMPGNHLALIIERMLRDLRANRSGFPDLLYLPDSGGYQLIEVKGPGDSVQVNQRLWLDFLHAQGIPVKVIHVRRP